MFVDEKRKYIKPNVLKKLTYLYKFLVAYAEFCKVGSQPFSDMKAVKKTINDIRYKKKMPAQDLLIYYDVLYKRYKKSCDDNHITENVLAQMEAMKPLSKSDSC